MNVDLFFAGSMQQVEADAKAILGNMEHAAYP